MHPPIQTTRSYCRRQPLHQIQQTTKEITKTINLNDYKKITDENDLNKPSHNLSAATTTSSKVSSVSLANIVAGNYSKKLQHNSRNNENYSSRLKYNNNPYQENIQPMVIKERSTNLKNIRNGDGKIHYNNINNNNVNSGYRYKSSKTINSYFGNSYGINRRHVLNNNNSNNNNTESVNKDDLRYTAKYWTSTTAATPSDIAKIVSNDKDKKNTNESGIALISLNSSDSSAVSTNVTVCCANSETKNHLEEEKKEITNESTSNSRKNGLEGIDLRNHASVVIVDYLPESSCDSYDQNDTDTDENFKIDDGFQQVMTRRKKKAEKIKAAAAAAAAASLINKDQISSKTTCYRSRRVRFRSKSKNENGQDLVHVAKITRPNSSANKKETNSNFASSTATSASSSSSASPTNDTESKGQQKQQYSYTPSERSANATTGPGAQKYNQVVNSRIKRGVILNPIKLVTNTSSTKVIDSAKKQEVTGNISPSVDLNLKIESCKKVWETSKKTATTSKKMVEFFPSSESTVDILSSSSSDSLASSKASDTSQTNLKQTVYSQKSPVPLLKCRYNETKTIDENIGDNAEKEDTNNFLTIPITVSTLNAESVVPETEILQCSNTDQPFFPPTDAISSCSNEEITISGDITISNFSYKYNYPLSSSVNNLVNNIIINNIPDSPSPSVLSMPSLSNNSFFQQTPTLSNMSQQKQQTVYQNLYHPFPNVPFHQGSQDYFQESYQEHNYPQYPNHYQNKQHHMPLLLPPYPIYRPQPPLVNPLNFFDQSVFLQHSHQPALIEENHKFKSVNEFPLAPGTYNNSQNMVSSIKSFTPHNYQSASNNSNSVIASDNTYNPFNTNLFFNPSSHSSDSNNSFFNYSNNSGVTPTLTQQQHNKNTDSNFYSLFSNQSNSNENENGVISTCAHPQIGFKRFHQSTVLSNSPMNQQVHNYHQHTSSEFSRLNNNKLNDVSLIKQPSFNKPLLDRLPSLDNSGINIYSSLSNVNTGTNSISNHFDHSKKNHPVTVPSHSFFNYNNYGLQGVCNVSTNTTGFNDHFFYPGQFYNNITHYQQHQPSAFVQTNASQPLISHTTKYQSPLLPHPPTQYAIKQPQQQYRKNEFLSQYNQMNRLPNYGNSTYQRNFSYTNNYQSQQNRRTGYGSNHNNLTTKTVNSSKNCSPPKPVQKITILPKPKTVISVESIEETQNMTDKPHHDDIKK